MKDGTAEDDKREQILAVPGANNIWIVAHGLLGFRYNASLMPEMIYAPVLNTGGRGIRDPLANQQLRIPEFQTGGGISGSAVRSSGTPK